MMLNRRFTLIAAALTLGTLAAGCSVQPVANATAATTGAPARAAIHVYTHREAGKDANHYTLHTLFIGEAASGGARYTAASFQNGSRYSLASSGNGSYAIGTGGEFTVKAGGLDAKGRIQPGVAIELDGKKFEYSTKL